jgi:hypothetical protein
MVFSGVLHKKDSIAPDNNALCPNHTALHP